ncbi:helix-turn-helix domain-containing protein [Natrinema caseinilyticum]|uniref:helix-turn-helix domain-containing protein n=1 Tax=Natrinema caseinilyticum TaxID=2961570 RepID=UPI0020C3DC2B|nr:helix-turn-helix domain-containing protein [Natrinema caseinilyticum]
MAGRPPDVTDEEILDLFEAADGNQLTTSDIKQQLGYTQSGAYRRLRTLEEAGYLRSRSIGNNTLWRLSDEYLTSE